MSAAQISPQSSAELARVCQFFGIELEVNRHLFRHVAQSDRASFERFMHLLCEAVEQDVRFGTSQRIRADLAQRRGGK